ncbi:hypothetical protein JS80_11020 [Anoxybacillus sp. KU2-6(11)]|nr:hypothetical protein JS80_11020 [Anoxybacillus sp. KU2-6(11)]
MMSKVEFIKRHLIEKLNEYIETSSTIYILTSFVMKSGVEVMKEPLRRAAERGADIKICTGDYLYVTQPEALRQLITIHPNIEVRLWKSDGFSFHPKAYLFENQNDGYFVIGSSNLSRSALTSGVEWNVGVPKWVEESVFAQVMNEFLTIFLCGTNGASKHRNVKAI